jgi:cystathionine beta-synthase
VVLLPDSGHRYLTKMFDDTWMRENGFLPAGWRAKSVAELLSGRPHLELTTVHPEDRMIDVAALLKAKGISQVPVVDGDGKLLGIVTETDLLEHLLHGAHVHNPAESIAAIVNPKVQTVPPESNVEAVLNAFDSDKVVIVAKADRPVGILTKIDLIDYVTGQIS